MFCRPCARSTVKACGFSPVGLLSAMVAPTSRMFCSPSSAKVTIFASQTSSSSHNGGMQPWATKKWICSGVPPEVAFEMAQAASFLISNSAVFRNLINGGMRLASMTLLM